MDGRLPHEAAEIEAWEEAGVTGEVAAQSLGVFHYDKLHPSRPALRCSVSVYPLRVGKTASKFPEQSERRRKWFSAPKAAKLVAETGLSDMLRSATKQLAIR